MPDDDTPADQPHAGREAAGAYGSSYHVPVLLHTVLDTLVTDPRGVYVDATLGGGGHTAALLDVLAPEARVIGIDQDPEALSEARTRLAEAEAAGRFQALRGNFGDLERLLADAGIETIDGLLLDLGVSSHQLDEAARGFSYAAEGRLDMRMDTAAPLSAHEVVNTWDEGELRRVLYAYGEESRGSKIARAIVRARPLETTAELADALRAAVPTRDEVKTLARVFQAIRIAVNGELEALERALEASVRLLSEGRRVAVISYHSLEDRRVKRFLRYGNWEGTPVRDLYGTLLTPWAEVTRKPLVADDAEVAANPRSRSARLRVAERQRHPLEEDPA